MRTIGNLQISGSLITSGSITATTFIGDGSGLTGVTSYTDADTLDYINTLGVVSSSAQLSNQTIPGDLTIGGKITAQEFHTEFVSASIIYQSGSTQFGDTTDDTHTFVGTLSATTILGVVSSSAQIDYSSIQNQPTIPTNNNQLTNGAGYTTCTGTVTSVTAGTYLTGGTITSTGTIAVDATNANTASKIVARDASGNFCAGTVTATCFVETSAQKYKTDIETFNCTDYFNCLRPVSFKWKENGSEDIGFIAEEINQFYPTLVAKSGEDEPTGVKYTKIVPLLVKKIQEQDTQINNLESKLNDIYNKINKDI